MNDEDEEYLYLFNKDTKRFSTKSHTPGLNERAEISMKKRDVKVTLSKLKFMED